MLNKSQLGAGPLRRIGVLALAVAALSLGAVAGPASAAPSASQGRSDNPNAGGSYVALGDSYTGGQGAAPWVDATCLQSASDSYPAFVSSMSSYHLRANNACSGATLAQLPAQFAGVNPNSTRLVTITIGGIDAGSNAILAACLPDPYALSCSQALAASEAGLPALGAQLAATYVALGTTVAPRATIAVLNYPHLLSPSLGVLAVPVNSAVDALNYTIVTAVAAAQAQAPNVVLVDVTQEFAGHEGGSADPYIALDFSNPFAPQNFHPNALGNRLGYAQALANDQLVSF